MKKYIILFAIIFCVSLTACQNDIKEAVNTETNKTQQSTSSNKTLDITVVSKTNTVNAGENASIKIKGLPGHTYEIDVIYNSGSSTATGLNEKTADKDGYVTWMWKVGGRTASGTYDIIISENGYTYKTSFNVE